MIARRRHSQPVQRMGVALLALATLVVSVGIADQYPDLDPLQFGRRLFRDLYANLGAELAGIAVTVLLIDRLHQRRTDENKRDMLILQMGSPDHSFAIEAVRMVAARDWLKHGALKGAHLSRANLKGANLQQVIIAEARLGLANLRHAKLIEADLQGTYLQGANLEEADLRGADLRGANLNDANLCGVRLDDSTLFNGDTILPDCTYWTPGTDMSRFTDSRHPDFWRGRGRAA